ncbi:MAG: dihydrofolate reductase [Christensenellales bacterium]
MILIFQLLIDWVSPLPKRENYVLTYETQLPLGGIVVKDLDALIESYSDKELFVIGGKMVYENLLSKVEKIIFNKSKRVSI